LRCEQRKKAGKDKLEMRSAHGGASLSSSAAGRGYSPGQEQQKEEIFAEDSR
jgi:hypothetical protein